MFPLGAHTRLSKSSCANATYNDLQQAKKTWNNLQRPEATYKKQETARNDLKRSERTYSEQEMTCNDLTLLTTSNKTIYKDLKRPTTSRFWDYYTILSNLFSSLTRFLPKIWLQWLEDCFMENHDENRAPNISIFFLFIYYGI